MTLWIEIIGYCGMTIILIALLMKEAKWFRLINLVGAVFNCTYGMFKTAYPSAILNGIIFVIDIIYLVILFTHKKKIVRFHRETGESKIFTVRKIKSRQDLRQIKVINDEIDVENYDISLYSAPTDAEMDESYDKDTIYCVFNGETLVAYLILLYDRGSTRDLSVYDKELFNNRKICASIDNVAVKKEYRGYGLEKVLIDEAKRDAKSRHKKKLLAVVSKNNFKSYASFMKCGFHVTRHDIPVYGSYRELVVFDFDRK